MGRRASEEHHVALVGAIHVHGEHSGLAPFLSMRFLARWLSR